MLLSLCYFMVAAAQRASLVDVELKATVVRTSGACYCTVCVPELFVKC